MSPTTPLTESEAAELGRAASRAGRQRTPFAHPLIQAEVADARVGEKTHLLIAFTRGWDEEHHRHLDQLLDQHESVTCPASTEVDGHTHSIVGCGRSIPDIRDAEGLVDCPQCGIWFDPDEEDQAK